MSLICRGTEARSVYDNHLNVREKAIEKTTCGVNLLTLVCVYWSLLFDNVNKIPPRQIVVPRYAVDNATLVFSPMPFHVKDYMIVNYLIVHPSLPNSISHQIKTEEVEGYDVAITWLVRECPRFQVKLRKDILMRLQCTLYLDIVTDLHANVNQTKRPHQECMESGYLVVFV